MDVLKKAICFIPDRLYFVSLRSKPVRMETKSHHFINIDDTFIYHNFYHDFGPLNIGIVFRYCTFLNDILNSNQYKGKKIVHCTCSNTMKRSNAACLIASYAILFLGCTPEEAYRPLSRLSPPLMPFRDASYGTCSFKLSVLHVLQGLSQAQLHGWFNFSTFNVEEYDHYEQVHNGDLNWILPGKFLAFAGPHNAKRVTVRGYTHLEPEDYFEYFIKHNVKHVVRLNTKQYESSRFAKAGITVHALVYPDGSTPPPGILKKFIDLAESVDGAIAVHCKAGLGRTGTLIGSFLMKHYMLTTPEAIGWMRLCRPGSVIGPQQYFLQDSQSDLWKEGASLGVQRKTRDGNGDWTNQVHAAILSNDAKQNVEPPHQTKALGINQVDIYTHSQNTLDLYSLNLTTDASNQSPRQDPRQEIHQTSPPGVLQGDGLKSQKEKRLRRGLSLGAVYVRNTNEVSSRSSTSSLESQIKNLPFGYPAPNKASRVSTPVCKPPGAVKTSSAKTPRPT
eukprot:m.86767 g.86767  ORF g.86767 m.86767 type:complete len:505 (+) comp26000_c0_seq1:175-1689(+)